MSKKKRTTTSKKSPYSEETFSEISELFDAQVSGVPEDKADQVKKFLSTFKDKFDVTAKDVIDVFNEKIGKVKTDAKNRFGTVLKLTRNHFDRAGKVSAKPYLGFVIGKQHRVNDINTTRISDLKAEYKGHENENTAEDVEINKVEYDTIITEYYKIANTNEEQAISYIKSILDGRFVVFTEVAEGEETVDDEFIENMETWSSGAKNFNFGKILKPSPSRIFTAVILEDGIAKLVDVNVKGKDRLDILDTSDNFKLMTMKVVKNENEGQRWWVDKAFNIESVDNDFEILGVSDPVKRDKKIIKHMLDAVPNEIQSPVDNIDSWQRKVKKKTGKDNILGLVKGTVSDIFYGDNDSVSITLTTDSYSLDELDMWDNDATELNFRIRVTPELAKDIDFEIDTVLFIWGEIYRGAFYDPQTRQFDEERKADMPSMNAWGFIADPELKNVREEADAITVDDLETEQEDGDTGFVVEDD